MRKLWIVGLVVAIALSGVVVVLPTARADMTKPTWSVGDYWAYNVTGASATLPASGTLRSDVVSTSDSAVVDGITYPSFRLSTVARLAAVSPFGGVYINLTGNTWYRISDLSMVKQVLSGTEEIPGVGSFGLTEQLTWSPPQDIQWPLTTASTWATRNWMNVTLTIFTIPVYQNTSLQTNWVVDADTPTTVPAGTFPTTPLRGTDATGAENITYWSPNVGNVVLQRMLDPTAVETQRIELTAYRYAVVQDAAPPTITGVNATPSPQDAGGSVTIGATVTDDTQVASVFANVTVPGGTHVNRSMTAGAGNRWTYAQAWSTVGIHNFTIWASDVAGKWASATGSFTIRQPDTEKPVITHTPPAGPFYTGTSITITATVTDNVAVQEVKIDFTNVTGVHQNLTMTHGSGSTYTYTIPAQSVAGTVTYTIYAVDPSGNANVTQRYSLTIQTPGGISSDVILYAGIGIVILVVVLTVALVLMRRRKKTAPPAEPPATPPPFNPPPPP